MTNDERDSLLARLDERTANIVKTLNGQMKGLSQEQQARVECREDLLKRVGEVSDSCIGASNKLKFKMLLVVFIAVFAGQGASNGIGALLKMVSEM